MKQKLTLVLLLTLLSANLFAQTLPSYVPSNGLVGWWPFNGSVNDGSGNGLNGVLTGGQYTSDRNGTANGAVLFATSSVGYLDINLGSSVSGQFSFMMWVRADRTANYVGESSVCPGAVSVPMANSNQNWALVANNYGTNLGVGVSVAQNGIMVGEHANNILVSRLSYQNTSASFNNIIVVYRNDSSFIYLNGNLVRSRPMYCATNTKVLGQNIRVGGSMYSPNFAGAIDEIGIWNRALTPTEVNTIFQSISNPPNPCAGIPQIAQNDTTICPNSTITLSAVNQNGNLTVGSTGPAGGFIFYDQGAVVNGWRYLEAAPSDIQRSVWGCPNNNLTGTSLAVGTGLSNSNAIVNQCSDTTTAAYRCLNHTVNGFSDWFLPSQGDFNLMYQNLAANGLGNFASSPIPGLGTLYWTSTQLTTASGSHCCFECGGNFYQYSKVYDLYVRPVRAFAALPATYLWSNGATTPNITVNPSQTTTYILTVTSNGVSCTDSVTVTVNSSACCVQPAPVTLGTSYTTELCPNEQVTIKVVTPAAGPNLTYQWTRNGTNMPGATTRSITVNDAAKYKVFVRSGPGVNCQRVSGLVETTAATPPTITATAPNGTALCPGDSVLMTAAGATAGYNYRWKRFGVVIAGANSSTFYATQTGNYRCEVYNAGGCITQSNLITISNGTSCRVMGEMDSDVSVYPNPAQNNFTVSFNDIGNEIPVSISLRNLQGQVIETRAVATTENTQFSVAKLAPGMYVVSIQLESGDTIEKQVLIGN